MSDGATAGTRTIGATLAGGAYDEIKRRILRLDIPPGSTFSELQLARALGSSKTPIRDALSQLKAEGLVEAIPRIGYRASPVTLKDTLDLLALRVLLEGDAAAVAAKRRMDVSEVRALDQRAAAAHVPGDVASLDGFLDSNSAIHRAIVRGSENERLISVLDLVIDASERVYRLALQVVPGGFDFYHTHDELFDTITAGDSDAARAVVERQSRISQSALIEALLSSPHLLSMSIELRTGVGGPSGPRPGRVVQPPSSVVPA